MTKEDADARVTTSIYCLLPAGSLCGYIPAADARPDRTETGTPMNTPAR